MNDQELRVRMLRAADAAGGAARMKPQGDQCRCGCGAMLARIVREGLELKCRKCKSLVLISHDELVEMYRALDFEPPPPLLPR